MTAYLIDACVPEGLLDELKRLGADAVRVSTESNFPDTGVLAFAFEQNRIVITNDKGFGDLVLRKRHPCIGAILLRVDVDLDTPAAHVAETILTLGDAAAGFFITIDTSGTRKRAF